MFLLGLLEFFKKNGEADLDYLLKEANLEYEKDDDGDYAITMYFEDDRSQVVFIGASPDDYAESKVYSIWSIGCADVSSVSDKILIKCLRNSSTKIMGAWEINGDELCYTAKMATPFTSSLLAEAINTVAAEADKFEEKFVGDDEL